MQVPWPHIRMKKPAKYGWFFSFFAGIFAIILINVLINVLASLISVPSPPPVAILYFAVCAFLAARVAGWIARTLGSEDYGWTAGAITAALFFLILQFPATPYHHPGWTSLISVFQSTLFSLLLIFPFCILGTALFIGGLHLWWRLRYSHWLLLSFILGSFFADSKADNPPTAADLSKIAITLQRSPCLGTCPFYKVTIHGNGRVVFTTEILPGLTSSIGVAWPGTHEDRIAPRTVAALFEQFQKAGFFDLRSAYRFAATDLPTYVLTIDMGQRRWSVEDYGGRGAGMPKVVTELEDAVDKAAGTDRWVRGSTGLIPWLEGQHFDFRSTEAAQLAASAAHGEADEAMVLALIDHGAPLDSEVSAYGPQVVKMIQERDSAYTPPPAGFSLIESAIRRGQAGLFNKLVAAGWLDRLGKEQAARLFAQHAAGCSPVLVDAAADAGIDIDKTESSGSPKPAITLPYGKTALGNLVTAPWCWHREADRVATARRLLARGADPNHRDASGHTALFGAENPVHGAVNSDMVKLLLAHGAERR